MQHRFLVRGALLLAVGVMIQQIRVMLPIPVPFSTLIIGSVVSAVLVLASRFTTRTISFLICLLLPIVAFLQGHLFMVVQIPVVFMSNSLYVYLLEKLKGKAALIGAPLLKTSIMALGIFIGAQMVGLKSQVTNPMILMMCWPQFVTGVLGIFLGNVITERLRLKL